MPFAPGPGALPPFNFAVPPIAPPPNIALGKPVIHSSEHTSGLFHDYYVNDGSYQSYWACDFNGTAIQWIYVDLGLSYAVNRVAIHWQNAYAASYEVQLSDDASTWTDIYNTTGVAAPASINLPDLVGTGRYARVYCTQLDGTHAGYGIWEFEIYGAVDDTLQAQACL